MSIFWEWQYWGETPEEAAEVAGMLAEAAPHIAVGSPTGSPSAPKQPRPLGTCPTTSLKERLRRAVPMSVDPKCVDWRQLACVASHDMLSTPTHPDLVEVSSGGHVFFCFFKSYQPSRNSRSSVRNVEMSPPQTPESGVGAEVLAGLYETDSTRSAPTLIPTEPTDHEPYLDPYDPDSSPMVSSSRPAADDTPASHSSLDGAPFSFFERRSASSSFTRYTTNPLPSPVPLDLDQTSGPCTPTSHIQLSSSFQAMPAFPPTLVAPQSTPVHEVESSASLKEWQSTTTQHTQQTAESAATVPTDPVPLPSAHAISAPSGLDTDMSLRLAPVPTKNTTSSCPPKPVTHNTSSTQTQSAPPPEHDTRILTLVETKSQTQTDDGTGILRQAVHASHLDNPEALPPPPSSVCITPLLTTSVPAVQAVHGTACTPDLFPTNSALRDPLLLHSLRESLSRDPPSQQSSRDTLVSPVPHWAINSLNSSGSFSSSYADGPGFIPHRSFVCEGVAVVKFARNRLLMQAEQFANELSRYLGICAPECRIIRQHGLSAVEWQGAHQAAQQLGGSATDFVECMQSLPCMLIMEYIKGAKLFESPAAFGLQPVPAMRSGRESGACTPLMSPMVKPVDNWACGVWGTPGEVLALTKGPADVVTPESGIREVPKPVPVLLMKVDLGHRRKQSGDADPALGAISTSAKKQDGVVSAVTAATEKVERVDRDAYQGNGLASVASNSEHGKDSGADPRLTCGGCPGVCTPHSSAGSPSAAANGRKLPTGNDAANAADAALVQSKMVALGQGGVHNSVLNSADGPTTDSSQRRLDPPLTPLSDCPRTTQETSQSSGAIHEAEPSVEGSSQGSDTAAYPLLPPVARSHSITPTSGPSADAATDSVAAVGAANSLPNGATDNLAAVGTADSILNGASDSVAAVGTAHALPNSATDNVPTSSITPLTAAVTAVKASTAISTSDDMAQNSSMSLVSRNPAAIGADPKVATTPSVSSAPAGADRKVATPPPVSSAPAGADPKGVSPVEWCWDGVALEALVQTMGDLGRLLLLDMLLGNADRLPCTELGWRGNTGNLMFAKQGSKYSGRMVAIDSCVQRRPPESKSAAEDQAIERLTQLVLADVEVAKSIIQQLLSAAPPEALCVLNCLPAVAAFQHGLKDCLGRVIKIKGLLEMIYRAMDEWISEFLADIRDYYDSPQSSPRGQHSSNPSFSAGSLSSGSLRSSSARPLHHSTTLPSKGVTQPTTPVPTSAPAPAASPTSVSKLFKSPSSPMRIRNGTGAGGGQVSTIMLSPRSFYALDEAKAGEGPPGSPVPAALLSIPLADSNGVSPLNLRGSGGASHTTSGLHQQLKLTMRLKKIGSVAKEDNRVGARLQHWKQVFKDRGVQLREAVDAWQEKQHLELPFTTGFLDGTHPIVDAYELKVRLDHMLRRLRALQNAAVLERPTEVTPRLFVGNAVSVEAHHMLRHLGITHIVNSTEEVISTPDSAGFVTLRVPLRDEVDACIQKYFDIVNTFIDGALSTGGGVLVHCSEGRSRSVTLVLAYLMVTHNWTLRAALDFVQERRPIASPNDGFLEKLLQLDARLHGCRSMKVVSKKPQPLVCPMCGETVGISAKRLGVHLRSKHGIAGAADSSSCYSSSSRQSSVVSSPKAAGKD